MVVNFVLMVNKQGQTRLSQYYDHLTLIEKSQLESKIIRTCLQRSDTKTSFIRHEPYTCVYRRYASLFFIIGCSKDESELSILELIHCLVETLDKYFENVCELDIMFNLERAHLILDEIIMCKQIVECNKKHILRPIRMLDSTQQNMQ